MPVQHEMERLGAISPVARQAIIRECKVGAVKDADGGLIARFDLFTLSTCVCDAGQTAASTGSSSVLSLGEQQNTTTLPAALPSTRRG
jgi:hypothetical protein